METSSPAMTEGAVLLAEKYQPATTKPSNFPLLARRGVAKPIILAGEVAIQP